MRQAAENKQGEDLKVKLHAYICASCLFSFVFARRRCQQRLPVQQTSGRPGPPWSTKCVGKRGQSSEKKSGMITLN